MTDSHDDSDERSTASRSLRNRPVLLVGSGPSCDFVDTRRIPPDPFVVRMNTFVLEDSYVFGDRVDALFWAVPRRWLMHAYALASDRGDYAFGQFFTTVRFGSDFLPCYTNEAARFGTFFVPRESHHSVLSRIPGVEGLVGPRKSRRSAQLPTQAFQSIGTLLALGFREFYVVGVDLYDGSESRYPFEIPPFLLRRIAPQHSTGKFESKYHGADTDIEYLTKLREAFPDARFWNLSPTSTFASLAPLAPVRTTHWTPSSRVKDSRSYLAELEARLVADEVRGEFSFRSPNVLFAWQWDSSRPDLRFTATFALDGQSCAIEKLDRFDEFLDWAGVGHGDCGRSIPIERLVRDRIGRSLSISIRTPDLREEVRREVRMFGRRRVDNTDVPVISIRTKPCFDGGLEYVIADSRLAGTDSEGHRTLRVTSPVPLGSDSVSIVTYDAAGERVVERLMFRSTGVQQLFRRLPNVHDMALAWVRRRYPEHDVVVDGEIILHPTQCGARWHESPALVQDLWEGRVSIEDPETDAAIVDVLARGRPIILLTSKGRFETCASVGLGRLLFAGDTFFNNVLLVSASTPKSVSDSIPGALRTSDVVLLVDGPSAFERHRQLIGAIANNKTRSVQVVVYWSHVAKSFGKTFATSLQELGIETIKHLVPDRRTLGRLGAMSIASIDTAIVLPAHLQVERREPSDLARTIVVVFDAIDRIDVVVRALDSLLLASNGMTRVFVYWTEEPTTNRLAEERLRGCVTIVDRARDVLDLATSGATFLQLGTAFGDLSALLVGVIESGATVGCLDTTACAEVVPGRLAFATIADFVERFESEEGIAPLDERERNAINSRFARVEVLERLIALMYGRSVRGSVRRALAAAGTSDRNMDGPTIDSLASLARLMASGSSDYRVGFGVSTTVDTEARIPVSIWVSNSRGLATSAWSSALSLEVTLVPMGRVGFPVTKRLPIEQGNAAHSIQTIELASPRESGSYRLIVQLWVNRAIEAASAVYDLTVVERPPAAVAISENEVSSVS